MKLPKIKLNLILTLALGLVLVFEIYLAYAHIFDNLSVESAEAVRSNIVRVNLESYKGTIEFLENQQSFTAPPINLKRANPFRP